MGGFLLKHVEHVDHPRELRRVDRPIGVSVEVIDELHQTAQIPLKPFRLTRDPAQLRDQECFAQHPLYRRRTRFQVLARGADQ